MSEEQTARWTEIKRGFARVQTMGGAEDDPAVRLLGQLGLMSDRLQDIGATILGASEAARAPEATEKDEQPGLGESLSGALGPYLKTLQHYLGALSKIAAQATAQGGGQTMTAEVQAVSQRLDSVLTTDRVSCTLDQLTDVDTRSADNAHLFQ